MKKITLTIRVVNGDVDSFELTDGDEYTISDSGTLVITDADGYVAVHYPAGAWLTLSVERS